MLGSIWAASNSSMKCTKSNFVSNLEKCFNWLSLIVHFFCFFCSTSTSIYSVASPVVTRKGEPVEVVVVPWTPCQIQTTVSPVQWTRETQMQQGMVSPPTVVITPTSTLPKIGNVIGSPIKLRLRIINSSPWRPSIPITIIIIIIIEEVELEMVQGRN